jgi:hypothetical protein
MLTPITWQRVRSEPALRASLITCLFLVISGVGFVQQLLWVNRGDGVTVAPYVSSIYLSLTMCKSMVT